MIRMDLTPGRRNAAFFCAHSALVQGAGVLRPSAGCDICHTIKVTNVLSQAATVSEF